MLIFIRNFLADQPAIFSWLRKIMELDFNKQKKIIKEVFGSGGGKKILDIGCGTGEFANLFIGSDYYGIDISTRYIKYAAKKNKGSFKAMNAAKLEFSDDSFDHILIMAVLHHLNDSDASRVLSEAARVLKSGGKMLVIEDAKIERLENSVIKFIMEYDKGEFIRRPEQYRNIITDYFTIISEQSFRNGCCVYHSLVLKSNKCFYDVQ